MKKLFSLAAAVLAVAAVFLASGMLSDESDASYASTFGSDSVGAERIVFDSNGGSGGYAQYVLNGNSVYFPTEYKASGVSNNTYSQISRSGYVLMGWSENSGASSPAYYPGQSYTVTTDRTFYAVWKSLTYDCYGQIGGSTDTVNVNAQRSIVPVNGSVSLDTSSDDYQVLELIRACHLERGGYSSLFTLTVNHDGRTYTSELRYVRSGTVSADWLTMEMSNGSISFSGTPNATGVTEVILDFRTYGMGSNVLDEFQVRWYVSSYDSNDPSNIFHCTYNGNDCGYGPYHTAVKLPNSVSVRQKGWNVIVDGSPAIFPVGGSYTLVKKETILTVNEYTFDEVAASGVAGVIAYNANGGSYNGAFAELVPSDGYTGLKNGSIVTKDGYTFLGWNPTGSSSDVIYPSGYLYDIQSDYTELKAVWGTPGSSVTIYFENPGDGSQNFSCVTSAGYRYALPVNGITLSGYDFIGWSETRYDVGTGTADAGNSVQVTSTRTYYAVFQPKVYTCTIEYDGNGGTGVLGDQVETVSSVPHYMTVAGCPFSYPGYSFAGWSETRYAESPSYLPGSSYCFTDSGKVTLYAVWTEAPLVTSNIFYLVFNGNGPSVTNVPPQVYRITPETETSFYVPSAVPQRDGYRFVGWSETSFGNARYDPGERITLSLTEGQNSKTLTLFAVWEQKVIGGDGTEVTVTFVADSGILRSVSVPSGNAVMQISAPSIEGRAFLGWFTPSGKWDFSSPVTGDMTLTAKYLRIFHLDVDENTVKVVLDCTSSTTRVQFSDGFTGTYDSSSIPAHQVTPNTSGSVTVTVTTEDGPFSAVCHYTATGETVEDDREEESKGFQIDNTVLYVAGGIVGILALFVVGRMFL